MRYLLLRHLGAFSLSILVAWRVMPLAIEFSRRWGWLDRPEGPLKRHEKPISHLGGFGIFLAFIIGLLPVFPVQNSALALVLGGILLLFLGVIDDLRVLSPGQKFLGQLFVTICLLLWGVRLKVGFFSHTESFILSGFWMMTVVNAFNLIDVMDGLATTVAVCGTVAFTVCAWWCGNFEVTLLLVALLGGLLGFFFYNRPPARIFLGDGGSHFVGGVLGAVPLLLSWSERSVHGMLAPPIILGVPLAETFLLVTIRLIKGIPPYRGSPHHFSIYLTNKSWSKGSVLGFTFVSATVLSLFGIALFLNVLSLTIVAISVSLSFAFFCWLVFFSPGWALPHTDEVLVRAAIRTANPRITNRPSRLH